MNLLPPAVRFALVVSIIYLALPLFIGFALFGFPGLVSVAVGLSTALYIYGALPRRLLLGIPGPPGYWLIGNLPDFIKTSSHEYYRKVIREYGSVVGILVGHNAQIIVADPDLIREVTVTKWECFADRSFPAQFRKSNDLLYAEGDDWRVARKTLNPSFNSVKLAAFASIISHHCDVLVRRLAKLADTKQGGHIDAVRLFGDLTMDVIASTSFDTDFRLQEKDPPTLEEFESSGKAGHDSSEPKARRKSLTQSQKLIEATMFLIGDQKGPLGAGGLLQTFVTVVTPFLLPLFRLLFLNFLQSPESKEFLYHLNNMESVLLDIVEGRSAMLKDNKKDTGVVTFIDLIRKARDPDSGIGLSDSNVRDQLNLFVIAGYKTTANALTYIAFLLAQHPEVEDRLVEEIKRLAPDKDKQLSFKDLHEFAFTTCVVNEALRLYPPAAFFTRKANCDVTLGDSRADGKQYTIKKNAGVVIPLYAVHRDERFWEDPDKFDPDRFSPERSANHTKHAFLPFGAGPRNCIGLRFAMEEMKLEVIAMYREFTFRLHPKTEIPLKLRASITLYPVDGVWVTVHRRG